MVRYRLGRLAQRPGLLAAAAGVAGGCAVRQGAVLHRRVRPGGAVLVRHAAVAPWAGAGHGRVAHQGLAVRRRPPTPWRDDGAWQRPPRLRLGGAAMIAAVPGMAMRR